MELSLAAIQAVVSAILPILSIWLLISGLDDLIVDTVAFAAERRRRGARGNSPSAETVMAHPQRPIAIFVPLWREADVIGPMIRQNSERIPYSDYQFFVGAYPNDEQTLSVVRELEAHFDHVHLALCPHPGPTSKADCLNWIFQRMLQLEAQHGQHFEIVVTHDAEDVIDAAALHWLNYHSATHAMVQVPVLPLPTPVTEWTHGVYCDEFAEFQARDMPARQAMRSFLPSNGVGTGFRRDALEQLAAETGNRIFEPVCLTEDYENGLRIALRGGKQVFVQPNDGLVATREYFPSRFRTAVKQRSRWVTGISLQTWDRHGWAGKMADKYWFWRDRKGLVGNPTALLSLLLMACGSALWALGHPPLWHWLYVPTCALGVYRGWYRMVVSGRMYGWRFAALVPVRIAYGTVVNATATIMALVRFGRHKWLGEPLAWAKTEHQYPSQAALAGTRRLLGEILVGSGYVTAEQLREAVALQTRGERLGELLMSLGYLKEEDLDDALLLQEGLPQSEVSPANVMARVARSLPAKTAEECGVFPLRVEWGSLVLASTELPTERMEATLRRYTRLPLRFYLVTRRNYRELVRTFY